MNRKDEIIKILGEHRYIGGTARRDMLERCKCTVLVLSHDEHLADMLLAVGPSS